MRILVQGKDLAVTKALRNFTKDQVNRKLSKISQRINQVRVYFEHISRKNGDPKRAVVRYKVELPGKDIVVKSRAKNLYQAIVTATDTMVRKVRKNKEKRMAKTRLPVEMEGQ
ncbi:MAG: ribosome-associated translation inhibitor RaiA [Candidatus Woesebacteria bacterium]|jgi:ribosomal subunit interface protein